MNKAASRQKAVKLLWHTTALLEDATYSVTNLDHVHGAVEVGAGAVHLVDETHTGHTVLVRLSAEVRSAMVAFMEAVVGESTC